ncbi:MAG: NADH-quinone oxidoreductase subunit C [Nitriliruptoraceae bacterium]
MTLDELQAALATAFPDARAEVALGELTVHVDPEDVMDVLTFAKSQLGCELLADLSGVHWPAGDHVVERQMSTTGWPQYRVSRDAGVIEVLYILRSVSHNHWFRVGTAVGDDAPVLPSATALYETANFHEREVYDFFGVEFTGHPDLTRILMPDDWLGHPHRKDYPLGGVDIPYHNDKFIPSPHERDLREVVE